MGQFIYTKSVKASAYVTYQSGVVAEVVDSSTQGESVFRFDDTQEVGILYNEYKRLTRDGQVMMIDLTRFDKIVNEYRDKCREWKSNGSR